ncbi:universal stress protein [Balneola sp. MJW-20]|uniref:universal stress protein n=1 Tax=Gracilimonas aurantiaca TaxID=3234185 RepID=UPI0034651A82
MKFKNILVATDFSDASLEAVKMADNFIDFYDSTIDLIHVIPLMSYFNDSMDHLGVPFDMENDLYPKAMERANDRLHEVASGYIPKEHCGQLINLVGRKISQVISERANNGQYDLVIMSSKGGHKTSHVRGATTEKVIRYSEIPVLTLDKSVKDSDINNILVPVDGSESSFSAIIAGYELASSFGAKVHLFHIIEPYTLGMEVLPPIVEEDEDVYRAIMQNLSKFLKEHESTMLELQRTGVDFEDRLVMTNNGISRSVELISHVSKGFSSHTEIVDYAEENADMVIMSTHGRTGMSRILLGSTTGTVAQHLRMPLLTLRPDYL